MNLEERLSHKIIALCITVLIEMRIWKHQANNHKRDFTFNLTIAHKVLDMKHLNIKILNYYCWKNMCATHHGVRHDVRHDKKIRFQFQLIAESDNEL